MKQGIKGATALITVLSTPGQNNNERAVRWRIGIKTPDGVIETHRQGIIHVAVQKRMAENEVDQVAELAALHDLLVGKEVLGVGRGGNGMIIQFSHGAIKKLVGWYNSVCDLPMKDRIDLLKSPATFNSGHLMAYGRFLFGRFFDAEMHVSKETNWMQPIEKLKAKNIWGVEVTDSLPDVVNVSEKLGKVEITMHAIERVAMRNSCDHQEAWRFIVNQLKSGYLRLVTEEHAKHNKLHHSHVNGDRWHNPESGFILAFSEHQDYKILTTMMPAVY